MNTLESYEKGNEKVFHLGSLIQSLVQATP